MILLESLAQDIEPLIVNPTAGYLESLQLCVLRNQATERNNPFRINFSVTEVQSLQRVVLQECMAYMPDSIGS
jgi:hypothetical protein